MSYSLEPAYTVYPELLRQLTRASTVPDNQWFFLEGSFSNLTAMIESHDTWLYENFVVIDNKKIVAYFEAEWARPLSTIYNFRLILLDKQKTITATKAFFVYMNYLFVSRGCDVFNWNVAVENTHAYSLYEKFIKNGCGHKVGKKTRSMKSYCGNISDSVLYEITKEEYFNWKKR
jgi:hypothetical protein